MDDDPRGVADVHVLLDREGLAVRQHADRRVEQQGDIVGVDDALQRVPKLLAAHGVVTVEEMRHLDRQRDDVLGGVPVPTPELRDPLGGFELRDEVRGRARRRRVARRFLQLLAVVDVDADTDHADGRAVVVGERAASSFQPVHRAVGPFDPMLEDEILSGLAGEVDVPGGVVAVLGVDELHVRVEGPGELAGLQAVERLHRGVPFDDAGRHVPAPRPHLDGLERERELLLAAAERALVPSALGHVAGDPDDRGDGAVLVEHRRVGDRHDAGRGVAAAHRRTRPTRACPRAAAP